MTTQTLASSQITVHPLDGALGARVRGIDMRKPLDDASKEVLLAAWMEHLILILPDQQVTDEEHVAFTHGLGLGEPEIFHQNIIKSKSVREIFRVSNVRDDNTLMPSTDPTARQLSLAQYWHTDSSYKTMPCLGSLLHGVEISRTGGETQFTNMYKVLAALPAELRQRIEGRKARHNFEHLHTLQTLRPLTDAERAAMPPVWHPMVRVHPVTGRQSLYISPIYNDQVEGLSGPESLALIAELAQFAGRSEFVYSHRWEPDDVMMWDNRCTMHQVTAFDPMERRVMHRTTIVGSQAVVAA
ncbi:TauD/TfdA dioxygenase family protein [Roseateles sp. GG27B]